MGVKDIIDLRKLIRTTSNEISSRLDQFAVKLHRSTLPRQTGRMQSQAMPRATRGSTELHKPLKNSFSEADVTVNRVSSLDSSSPPRTPRKHQEEIGNLRGSWNALDVPRDLQVLGAVRNSNDCASKKHMPAFEDASGLRDTGNCVRFLDNPTMPHSLPEPFRTDTLHHSEVGDTLDSVHAFGSQPGEVGIFQRQIGRLHASLSVGLYEIERMQSRFPCDDSGGLHGIQASPASRIVPPSFTEHPSKIVAPPPFVDWPSESSDRDVR